MIRICNWSEVFENNRSRAIENLSWVSIPNKHDGEGYATVMAHKDSAEIFAAWILMVQLASRVSKVRRDGSLVRPDGTPTSIAAMAVKTRVPEDWFRKAIPVLVEVGWIERLVEQASPERQADVTPASPERQETDVKVPRIGGEGRGQKGSGGKAPPRPTLPEVVEFCKTIDLPTSDGEATFHKWEGNGFTNGGKPIKDWQATIRAWKASGYMPSQKGVNGKNTGAQPTGLTPRPLN